jgi:hypothetical protein
VAGIDPASPGARQRNARRLICSCLSCELSRTAHRPIDMVLAVAEESEITSRKFGISEGGMSL